MTLIIRTSDRGMFKSCRRKWDLGSKIRQNYEPYVTPKPFEFGTAIHAGLEAYYDPKSWDWPHEERMSLCVTAFLNVCTEQLRAHVKASGQESAGVDIEMDFNERTALGIGMLTYYCQYYKERDSFFKPLKVELEFEVPIPYNGPDGDHYRSHDGFLQIWYEDAWHDVVYQGRIDMLVEDKNGNYWLWDHKTRGQFGSTEHYDLDEQSGSYAWALQHVLGIQVRGVVFNELLKSIPKPPEVLKSGKISKNKQQRTTFELYMRALSEHNQPPSDYWEFLDFLKGQENPFLRRVQVHRTPYELKALGNQIAIEAIDIFDPNLRIYPNPGMFNCMGCAYRRPCLALNDGSDVNWILNETYRKRDEQEEVTVVED